MKKLGLIDFWLNKYFLDKFYKIYSNDILEKEEVFEELSFGHTVYAFKTVLFGVGTASLVLIIELVYNYFDSKLSTNPYNFQYNH